MEQGTGRTDDPHRAEVPWRKKVAYIKIFHTAIIVEVWLLRASVFIAGWLGGFTARQCEGVWGKPFKANVNTEFCEGKCGNSVSASHVHCQLQWE